MGAAAHIFAVSKFSIENAKRVSMLVSLMVNHIANGNDCNCACHLESVFVNQDTNTKCNDD